MRRRDFLSATLATAFAQSAAAMPVSTRRSLVGGRSSQLKKFQAALAQQRAGTRNARIAVVGDSTAAGWGSTGSGQQNSINDSWPSRLTRLIPGAHATTCFGDHNSLIGSPGTITLPAIDPKVTSLGSWTQATTNTKTFGGPMLVCTSGTTAMTYATTRNIDTFVVYYRTTPGAGSFNISIDGGATTLCDQNAANGLTSRTVTSSVGIHTLSLARVAGNCDLVGIYAFDSTSKEVSIINGGWSGSTSVDWTASVANAWDALPVLQALLPDLTIICLTINDWNAGTALATFSANLQAAITAGKVSGDVIVMTGVPTNPTGHASVLTQQTYIDAAQAVAASNKCPFVNMTARWGSWTAKQAIGWYFDDLHANSIGYGDQAAAVFAAMGIQSAIRTSGLISYLPLDTGDFNFGTNLVTERSGGNALRCPITLFAAPSVVTGQIAQGLTYDGVTDQYVSFPDSFFDDQYIGMLTAWINMTTLVAGAGAEAIFGGASATAVNSLFNVNLFGNTGADTRLRIGARNNADVLMGNTSITAGVWHFIAAWSDGLTTNLSVDNVLQTLTVSAGSNTGKWMASSVAGAMRWTVGNLRRSSGDIFLNKGIVDDFRVYNNPASDAQRTTIYQQGLIGIAAGL